MGLPQIDILPFLRQGLTPAHHESRHLETIVLKATRTSANSRIRRIMTEEGNPGHPSSNLRVLFYSAEMRSIVSERPLALEGGTWMAIEDFGPLLFALGFFGFDQPKRPGLASIW